MAAPTGLRQGRDAGYGELREQAEDFLKNYQPMYALDGETPKYVKQMQSVADRELRAFEISVADLEAHEDDELLEAVRTNSCRMADIFADAIDARMPPPSIDGASIQRDAVDVLNDQRQQVQQEGEDNGEISPNDRKQALPPSLLRRYEVYFVPGDSAKLKPKALRDVRAEHIGQLVTVRGIVTRVTDVKPQVSVATFSCEACGADVFQEVPKRTFTPPSNCPSCKAALPPTLQPRGSRLDKHQELKMQEMTEHVPMGSVPRSMVVQLTGERTRTAGPGDEVSITGVFMPVAFSGWKGMRAGLIADTYLQATHVRQHKRTAAAEMADEEAAEKVRELREDEDVYEKLALSIAPEIYGHEDIKKALLLQMVGAPTRVLEDGMKLRGDMHVCLMGDPGVAKSQLLKHICRLAPRAVYTTGRGSSGVGLTAAVHRDPVTNEFVLEGGALVLGDNGICAIDEFDKMEEGDRTAIHEVMEQQMVSIAKAGITTRLNARTAVLAAANPAYGRYDLRRTPGENIALPAALLSRFDLLFLILDRADPELDSMLARHILHVHRERRAPKLEFDAVPEADMRAYVAAAKAVEPAVPPELADYLASTYAAMRQEEVEAGAQTATYCTARTLLSILRMSEALARLRFGDEVAQADVDEALRLMRMSKHSLVDDQDEENKAVDHVTAIYRLIRDRAVRDDGAALPYATARELVVRTTSFSEDQLNETLDIYAGLNVFHLGVTRDITLVN